MSKMKAFLEQVSVDMGYGGEFNHLVFAEATKRMHEFFSNEQNAEDNQSKDDSKE